jgi:hypothetical protein
MTKSLASLCVCALLIVGAGACGSARTDTSPSAASAPGSGSLMSDEDRDSRGSGYYDGDDGGIRYYGKAAEPSEASAIAAVVHDYYAAAEAQDGAKACGLTYYIEVETLAEHYGQPPGPLWLRGASTCTAVLSRVFGHFHSELTAPVQVTGVRVEGDHAQALVGFATLPAGYVKLRREGGTWKVDDLLALPLP